MALEDNNRVHTRVFHGVRVRVHPETHPRAFAKDSLRYACIRDNLELAMKCIPISERRLYAHLAPALAHVIWQANYFAALEGKGEKQTEMEFGAERDFVKPSRADIWKGRG